MSSVADLYAPLIERDLAAVPAAVAEFRKTNDSQELFLAIARFSVLAFAPSEHAKHALLAALAAYDLRDEYGNRWDELLTECARYTAASRQPWSEPPLLDPPAVEPDQPRDLAALQSAIAAGDRLAGERWLASRLEDPELRRDLITAASDSFEDFGADLIITASALRLAALLGEKGRFAVLRVPIWQMTARSRRAIDDRDSRLEIRDSAGVPTNRESRIPNPSTARLLDRLVATAVEERGSIESIHRILLFEAAVGTDCDRALSFLARTSTDIEPLSETTPARAPAPVYALARDYAQTVIAHAVARRLGARFPAADLDAFVAAAEYNREHGDSYDEWSFA